MAPARSSNKERAEWRTKCRHKLSEHIKRNLGIVIEPAQVRLITSKSDLYSWKILLGNEYLFQKHLSKHSIGAYMKLYRGAGVSFEAVRAFEFKEATLRDPETQQESLEGKASFTAVIESLQGDNEKLDTEVIHWKNRAESAEEKTTQLKMSIEADRQENKRKVALLAERWRNITFESSQEMEKLFEGWEVPSSSKRIQVGLGEFTIFSHR